MEKKHPSYKESGFSNLHARAPFDLYVGILCLGRLGWGTPKLHVLDLVADKCHWADNYYIASRDVPELIMSDVMRFFTAKMVCELFGRRCNSGRCMIGCLPCARNTKITLHQSLGNSFL